jgi:hypothetical protein
MIGVGREQQNATNFRSFNDDPNMAVNLTN